MKWLHISDIHFNPERDGRSTLQARNKLSNYLKDNQITADHLFVTGDYRNAKFQKDTEKEVAQQAVEYLLEIAASANVPYANIHVIPGNHDVTRLKEQKFIDKFTEIKNKYNVQNGQIQEADMEFLIDRFSFFKQIIEELKVQGHINSIFQDSLQPIHPYQCYDEFNLLYLNTNLFCNDDDDRGSLIVGNCELYKSLEGIKAKGGNSPIIVLAHHSVEYVRDDERKVIEQLFEEYPVKLYLCGDAHKPWRRCTNGVQEITMGCLVSEPDVNTVFSTGELEKGTFKLKAHQWDPFFTEWGFYSQFDKVINRKDAHSKKTEDQTSVLSESTPFFEERICDAFPGTRGIKEIKDKEKIREGLKILLRSPLCSSNDDLIAVFEGSSYFPVKDICFEDNTLLINKCDEIVIESLYVYHASSYYKDFIYIVTQELDAGASFYKTEYALFEEQIISSSEYDDGSATINGKIVRLNDKAQSRIKYNRKTGFFICAKYNPINFKNADLILEEMQNHIDRGTFDINMLREEVDRLERNPRDM